MTKALSMGMAEEDRTDLLGFVEVAAMVIEAADGLEAIHGGVDDAFDL